MDVVMENFTSTIKRRTIFIEVGSTYLSALWYYLRICDGIFTALKSKVLLLFFSWETFSQKHSIDNDDDVIVLTRYGLIVGGTKRRHHYK